MNDKINLTEDQMMWYYNEEIKKIKQSIIDINEM